MAVSKLYFHGNCLACLGSSLTWYKRKCPYCSEGLTYHEVGDRTVKDYVLENMNENDKKELFIELAKQFGEENEDEQL